MFGNKNKPQFTDDVEAGKRDSFFITTFGPRVARWIFAFIEIVQVGVLSLALVVLIRTFLIQPFYVKGASMEPNFFDHEYLIIDEITYRFRNPMRGEIIVFRYPRDPREYFIKRIVGLPGETVEIKNNEIYINGELLDESYIDVETRGDDRVNLGPREYFLLGDNRSASLDSRIFGPINVDAIIGRVWIRGWPIDSIGTFETPEY